MSFGGWCGLICTMTKLICEITMSLDGYVAGPDPTLEHPLGVGGERLHEWATRLASWRESHGYEGGETNPDSDLLEQSLRTTGAVIMGRRMFSGGEGPWENDPNANGWWGDEPPFGVPVFILTHHERESVELKGGNSFTFVTDGLQSAIEQARAAAGDRNVSLGGGGDVMQQYLREGVVDEFLLHIAPVFLGGGVRLFDNLGDSPPELEIIEAIHSPVVTHVRYRVK
jgi:dihydrofolate reductase